MAATKKDVDSWIKEAKDNNKKKNNKTVTHIISVCDTFDYDDYPVFVHGPSELIEKKKEYDGINMQRINEIIKID